MIPLPWNPRGDAGFHWRGREVSRLEGFSDAVFGFAITLLVVSLEVPRSFDHLVAALREAGVFAICFAHLYTVWEKHHVFFRRFGLQDGWTSLVNGVLLFVVVLYVYPLKFLWALVSDMMFGRTGTSIRPEQVPAMFEVYAAGFIAVFALVSLLYLHALRHATDLRLSPLELRLTQLELWRNCLMAAVAVSSGALAFFLPLRSAGLSGFAYTLIGAVESWHGSAEGNAKRRFDAAQPVSEAA